MLSASFYLGSRWALVSLFLVSLFHFRLAIVMAEEFDHDQRELAQLWKRARKDGCMPPWQQAKVFGLKEAWEEMHGDKTYGQLKWIAERVYVQGHPKRHPSHEAVRQLLEKMATNM